MFSSWDEGGFQSRYPNTIHPFANPLSRLLFFDYPLWNLKVLLKIKKNEEKNK